MPGCLASVDSAGAKQGTPRSCADLDAQWPPEVGLQGAEDERRLAHVEQAGRQAEDESAPRGPQLHGCDGPQDLGHVHRDGAGDGDRRRAAGDGHR